MKLLSLLLLLLILPLSSFSSSNGNPNPLPRPLIIELPSASSEDTQVRCDSWRFLVEANNLPSWKNVPLECGDYVEDYMMGRRYRYDVEMVMREASEYARSVEMVGDGMDAWVFDIDETLLSNLPYYVDHGFGLELFNGQEFDKWVAKAIAPAIESSIKFYEEVLGLGFKIFLLTGRTEGQRSITIDNLYIVGFHDWEKLILRGLDDQGKTATTYKSEKRSEIIADGYRIVGNSGDQWSDLLGSYMKHSQVSILDKSLCCQPSSPGYQLLCMIRSCTYGMKDMKDSCKQSHKHNHEEEHNYSRMVKFCKNMVEDFSRRMGPSGNKWHVGLRKSTASTVFLQYGWKEFVEAHYLEENDTLIFKYESGLCFSVVIFDSSGCKREFSYFAKNEHLEKQDATEYSLKNVEQSTAAAHEGYNCSFKSILNVDDIPEKSSSSNSDRRGDFCCCRSGTEKREDIVSSKPDVVEASLLGNQPERRNLPMRLATDAERDVAMQLAHAFTPTRPSFLKVMKGYNVCTQFQLLILPDFARKLLPQESQDAILIVTNARDEWKVKYVVSESSSHFIGKWRNFARDNNLKVRDVCVFELSRERKRVAMIVHIFRARNMVTPSTR